MSLNLEINKLVDMGMELPDLLDIVNKTAIKRAVFIHRGNQTAAAKQLKTHRGTVRKYLDEDTQPRPGSHFTRTGV